MPPTQLTDLHALYEHILSQLSCRSLARICCVSRELGTAAACDCVWREAFARSHGEHSAEWATMLDPVRANAPVLCLACGAEHDPRAWRIRCELRSRAASSRRAGLCHHRTMRFELGDRPETSEFYVSAFALNGCWLALGEASGALSIWDLRSGRRQWRMARTSSYVEDDSVDELHLDAVAGLIAASSSYSGIVSIPQVADGKLVAAVSHYPVVRLLDPCEDFVAASSAAVVKDSEMICREMDRELADEHGGDAEDADEDPGSGAGKTTPNLVGGLVRARLCSGERAGDTSLPLCLLTLCDIPDPDSDIPDPLGLLFHIAAPATLFDTAVQFDIAAPVPQRWASHAFTGLMSEQAAMMATVEVSEDDPLRWGVTLLDIHTLLPLGSGLLPLGPYRLVSQISLQRRSAVEWWLLVESGAPSNDALQLDVVRLLLSHTAGTEATVQVMPYRSISLGFPIGGLRQPDWWSFDQHRWDMIGCTSGLAVHLLDLSPAAGLWLGPAVFPAGECAPTREPISRGWEPISRGSWEPIIGAPILDLRGLCGGGDERHRPSVLLQGRHEDTYSETSLAIWDGGERAVELCSTPACAALRGLLASREPAVLLFEQPPGEDTSLGCAANWRFVVAIDAVGVHVLDFLPTKYKAAADGVGRR